VEANDTYASEVNRFALERFSKENEIGKFYSNCEAKKAILKPLTKEQQSVTLSPMKCIFCNFPFRQFNTRSSSLKGLQPDGSTDSEDIERGWIEASFRFWPPQPRFPERRYSIKK
jgi:hypothetical protein